MSSWKFPETPLENSTISPSSLPQPGPSLPSTHSAPGPCADLLGLLLANRLPPRGEGARFIRDGSHKVLSRGGADPESCKPPGLMVALTSSTNLQPQAMLRVSALAGEGDKGSWKQNTSEVSITTSYSMKKASCGRFWDVPQGQHTMPGHRHSHRPLNHMLPVVSITGLWVVAAGRAGRSQSYAKTQQGPDPAHRQETFLPWELHRCG